MILGIGYDLIDARRLERVYNRFGERFLKRCFGEAEVARARSRRYGFIMTLAKRYAAKEACAKALGTGLARGLSWKDIEVRNLKGGQPVLVLSGAGQKHLDRLKGSHKEVQILVTLTDEPPYAAAQVLIETI